MEEGRDPPLDFKIYFHILLKGRSAGRGRPSSPHKAAMSDGMSVEDMNLAIVELTEELERLVEEKEIKDETITELQRENEVLRRSGGRRGGGGGGGEDASERIMALENEVEETRDKYDQLEQQFGEQREIAVDKTTQLAVITSQRDELENDLKKQTDRVTSLEKELLDFKDSVRSKLRSTADAKKKNQESQKEHLEMYETVEKLQVENKEIEKQLEDEVGRRVELESVLTSMQEHINILEAHKDGNEAAKEELNSKILDLDGLLEEAQEQVAQ